MGSGRDRSSTGIRRCTSRAPMSSSFSQGTKGKGRLQMLRASVMAALTAAALAGCATERDPIDRTQPNGLTKELFQGEWYYQQTVVDIPGTWSFTFVGETNWAGMERVRWDIQEDWLYARRSYEKIKNAEGGVDNADANP